MNVLRRWIAQRKAQRELEDRETQWENRAAARTEEMARRKWLDAENRAQLKWDVVRCAIKLGLNTTEVRKNWWAAELEQRAAATELFEARGRDW